MNRIFSPQETNHYLPRLMAARDRLLGQLQDCQGELGQWEGRLSSSAVSTATAVSALSFYLRSRQESNSEARSKSASYQRQCGIAWLEKHINKDGGWGDTEASYSNISTTLLGMSAFRAAGGVNDDGPLAGMNRAYFEKKGGLDGVRRRYGSDRTFSVPILANAAMAGLVPWSEVAALPFEATLIPQKFFHLLQLPVVSYAIPALVAIGQVKFANDPPKNPMTRLLRSAAIGPSLRLLEKMQPASGGFLEAVPLTSFVAMGLINAGQSHSPVVERCIDFILNSFRADGTWPIDTNLATWNTTLTINALGNDWPGELATNPWGKTIDWLLGCQHNARHPFTNAAPGGWGWTDLSGAVPDADDTPGALLAIANLQKNVNFPDRIRQKMTAAATAGVKWLLGIQNRDGGWPTFCKGWGRLPFDRSGADISAHVIRGLLAWQTENNRQKIDAAVSRGFRYLDRKQLSDGSWLPLWFGNQDMPDDVNPCYGTAKVILAYLTAGRFGTLPVENGLNWIRQNQHPEGGWGGGPSIRELIQPLGCGSLEETSLCLETLVVANRNEDRESIVRGTEWLLSAIEGDEIQFSRPIGFYFAKLWYDERHYPLVFGLSALGRLISVLSKAPENENQPNNG